ncbi:MAG: ribosome silencing factor [candidate division Zixibacteria bacterium]|nr:ribosome silencing factor [candidate division Zixibacteria bacterium]
MTPKQIARKVGKLALEKNGFDVYLMDLRKSSDVTNYFVIISGSVDVHVKAITDNIIGGLKQKDVRAWHVEGYKNLKWVLLDYITVVVHIFQPDVREYYSLEKLWGDAPGEKLE